MSSPPSGGGRIVARKRLAGRFLALGAVVPTLCTRQLPSGTDPAILDGTAKGRCLANRQKAPYLQAFSSGGGLPVKIPLFVRTPYRRATSSRIRYEPDGRRRIHIPGTHFFLQRSFSFFGASPYSGGSFWLP